MNAGPLFARLAGKVLGEAPNRLPPPHPADRAKTIDAIGKALREKATRKSARRRLAYVLAGVAAVAAAVVVAGTSRRATAPQAAQRATTQPMGIASLVEGSVAVTSNLRTRALADGNPVGVGDRIVARTDSRAVVVLQTGTRIVIEGEGDFAIEGKGAMQLFELSAGSVRAEVAKLVSGERFIIRTRDAEIEVKGTSFRIATAESDASCGSGTTTRVAVYEGVVAVRAGGNEARVAAGDSWPKGCGGHEVAVASSDAGSASRAVPASAPPKSPSATERTGSELAAQNDLFDHGVDAKRRGDSSSALAAFQELLARYPGSPLAEAASAERMRLLQAVDPSRAPAAAREYLSRYPSGFARADAEKIASGLR
jgi:ferric-dicitrate binding protein FerR (iron transport regulator)